HVFFRRIVETMPAAARRVDDVTLNRRLEPLSGDDVAATLEHDEKLVAVTVQVPLMTGTRPQHGPADDMIGARRLLVDQELHLHVDPAFLSLESLDLRDVLDVGAVHLAHFACPPSRRYTWCATTKSLASMPSPRQAFIISLAAAASG